MSEREIRRLLAAVDELPESSPVGVSLLEEAVRIADAANDSERSYELRLEIMHRIYYTGDWDRLLVHFGYCLAASDREPRQFAENTLLWKYKWVLNQVARMPVIGRERVLGLLSDMERRFLSHGSTLRAVHEHRAIALAKLGDLDGARASIEKWFEAPRDRLADCHACELDCRIELLQQLGDHEAAHDRASDLLSRGASCSEVPHCTLGRTLGFLRAHDPAQADENHARGYRLCKPVGKLVEAHAQHLLHVAVRGDDKEAALMLERHLEGALAHPSAWGRVAFLASVRRTAELWQERGRESMPVRFPEETGLGDGPSTKEVLRWATDELAANAAAFDARNGNAVVSAWAQRWHEWGA